MEVRGLLPRHRSYVVPEESVEIDRARVSGDASLLGISFEKLAIESLAVYG